MRVVWIGNLLGSPEKSFIHPSTVVHNYQPFFFSLPTKPRALSSSLLLQRALEPQLVPQNTNYFFMAFNTGRLQEGCNCYAQNAPTTHFTQKFLVSKMSHSEGVKI